MVLIVYNIIRGRWHDMLRFVHGSESIMCMAYERPKALALLRKNDDTLSEHIIKCIVYDDSTGNYSHWVEDEICDYIYKANNITVKPKNKKPKKEDYISTLFASFGDSKNDAATNLGMFLIDNRNHRLDKQYPTFEITDELVSQLYNAYQNIISATIPILTTINDYTKDDFENIIYDALNV